MQAFDPASGRPRGLNSFPSLVRHLSLSTLMTIEDVARAAGTQADFSPRCDPTACAGYSRPEHDSQGRQRLAKWGEMISSGSIDSQKEQEILGDFINDVFCELLGYTRVVDSPKRYSVEGP
jgi:hypothetical protein